MISIQPTNSDESKATSPMVARKPTSEEIRIGIDRQLITPIEQCRYFLSRLLKIDCANEPDKVFFRRLNQFLSAEGGYSIHHWQNVTFAEIADLLGRLYHDLDEAEIATSGDTVSEDKAPFRHNSDFSCVNWHGIEFTFTPTQAKCVELLVEQYEQGFPNVTFKTIKALGICQSDQVRDVFRRRGRLHPAIGRMILKVRKGVLRFSQELKAETPASPQ